MTKDDFILSLNDRLSDLNGCVKTAHHDGPANASYTRTFRGSDLWLAPVSDSDLSAIDFPKLTEAQFLELTRLRSEFNNLCGAVDPNSPVPQDTSAKARKLLMDIAQLVE